MTKLLSTTEAAAVIGRTPREVKRLCKIGKLPAQMVGGRYAIKQKDAEAYVAAPAHRPKETK